MSEIQLMKEFSRMSGQEKCNFQVIQYRNEHRLFSPPPPEATVPRSFHSMVLSPTEVRLSWGPAPNKNSRISGYTIYQVSNEWTSRLVIVLNPMRAETIWVSESRLVLSQPMNTNHEPIIGSWLVCVCQVMNTCKCRCDNTFVCLSFVVH